MAVTVILLIIIVALAAFLFLLKREVRSIKRQLHERINGNEKPVEVSLIDKDITGLASEINEVVFYCKEQNIEILKRERQLKEAISNISHDLRTPLTSIIGHLQLLHKTVLEPGQRVYVETVLSRSEDLRNLISDFYDISVWEAKESTPSLKKINLDNLLANTVLAYTEQFEKNAITLHILFLDEPTYVIADEAMLKRVVDNLISNVINYGNDDLKITIKKDDKVSVTFQNVVQDGQWIDVNRLFNKFYMVDLSRSHSGTGLGLYIVKLLMVKMGGTVKAKFKDNHLSIDLSLEKPIK